MLRFISRIFNEKYSYHNLPEVAGKEEIFKFLPFRLLVILWHVCYFLVNIITHYIYLSILLVTPMKRNENSSNFSERLFVQIPLEKISFQNGSLLKFWGRLEGLTKRKNFRSWYHSIVEDLWQFPIRELFFALPPPPLHPNSVVKLTSE